METARVTMSRAFGGFPGKIVQGGERAIIPLHHSVEMVFEKPRRSETTVLSLERSYRIWTVAGQLRRFQAPADNTSAASNVMKIPGPDSEIAEALGGECRFIIDRALPAVVIVVTELIVEVISIHR
jgi:hypothetical protein